jgi:hypothetical protein
MPPQEKDFLRRWSRRKREAAAVPVTAAKAELAETPAELPAVEGLSFESDFRAFMHAAVDQVTRRAALKKLFRDPRFNVMDGLDVYIDDYTQEVPIPPGMLAQLEHARTTLFGPQPEKDAPPEDQPVAQAGGPVANDDDTGASR